MAPQATLMARLKVQLKLSIARLRMLQQKDEATSKQLRRAMAQLLESGKEGSARIRVENIIRLDIATELHEILELYCELLLARIGLLEAKDCDPGLEEAVKSLMYAAPRIECKEVQSVRQILAEKYGKDFAVAAAENRDGVVSAVVIKKLGVKPPPAALVEGYLEEIAATYGVDWPRRSGVDGFTAPEAADGGNDVDGDDGPPSGGQAQKVLETPIATDARDAEERAELSRATPPRTLGPSSPLRVNPPSATTDNLHPRVRGTGTLDLKPTQKMQDAALKKGIESRGAVGGTIPDIDELAKRFAALKK